MFKLLHIFYQKKADLMLFLRKKSYLNKMFAHFDYLHDNCRLLHNFMGI